MRNADYKIIFGCALARNWILNATIRESFHGVPVLGNTMRLVVHMLTAGENSLQVQQKCRGSRGKAGGRIEWRANGTIVSCAQITTADHHPICIPFIHIGWRILVATTTALLLDFTLVSRAKDWNGGKGGRLEHKKISANLNVASSPVEVKWKNSSDIEPNCKLMRILLRATAAIMASSAQELFFRNDCKVIG